MLDFTSNPDKPGIGSVISGRAPVTSFSFHSSGKRLFMASERDSRLHVVDCWKGKEDRPALKFENETIRTVHATHHEDCVLCTKSSRTAGVLSSPTPPVALTPQQQSAAEEQHAINYMSVYDNKMIRKFRGHTNDVTCLSQSPENDTFLSSAKDRKVRLWTLQSAGCLAECGLPTETRAPLTVFDSTGLVFGITAQMNNLQGHHLHLYDARNHAAGAFAELKISQSDLSDAIVKASSSTTTPVTPDRARLLAQQPWNKMEFNASGTQILIGSGMGLSIVLDGFEGTIQKVLLGQRANSPAVSCFSGDDKYVLTGNDNGTIDCWVMDESTGVGSSVVRRLDTGTGLPVDQLAFNPAMSQFVCSASRDVALWIW